MYKKEFLRGQLLLPSDCQQNPLGSYQDQDVPSHTTLLNIQPLKGDKGTEVRHWGCKCR